MRNWFRGADPAGDEITVLRAWVEQLTQDNMRLRLNQQRPSSPGQFAHNLRELSSELAALPPTSEDAEDEALHALAEAQMVRRTVVDVLVNLQVLAAQMERQLIGELPHAEIDRRVLSGRGASSPGGQRSLDRRASTGAGDRVAADGTSASAVLAQMEHMLDGEMLDVEMTDAPLGRATGQAVG